MNHPESIKKEFVEIDLTETESAEAGGSRSRSQSSFATDETEKTQSFLRSDLKNSNAEQNFDIQIIGNCCEHCVAAKPKTVININDTSIDNLIVHQHYHHGN